ncbi:DUF6262 family protein [Bosea sp. (in: a-proteobacteria)]|uniref:DUF6262 family protein n=1 Tax=Bosea sp. (in: a-proteobacteria) TaxID=1871050 RepID=UPI0025BFD934|nr:DUF6262 family protein [Bosea sp. (in: a-proteobacteria)]
MTEELSGAALGAENVEKLRRYLHQLSDEKQPLPERNGRANVSAIALACGFDRQVLYKNPGAKRLLAEAVAELGLDAPAPTDAASEAPQADRRDRRIQRLEQENAALRAELTELRERMRRLHHVEAHMVESGRFVSQLFPSLGETGE